jgi:GH15 family glucan-1,4-alpha-glucosidase
MAGDHRGGHQAAPETAYPAIEDYGIIGDCRTAALISRHGSIDWLCLPHFSGPAVFSAMLDQRIGGRFSIGPAAADDDDEDDSAEVSRRYVGATNVLETTFRSPDGTFRITDCMPVLSGPEWEALLGPQRELLRIVDCDSGEAAVDVIYQPRPDFARAQPRLESRGALGWACPFGNDQLSLHADAELTASDDHRTLRARLRLRAGQRHYFSLTYVAHDMAVVAPLGDPARRRLQATLEWWEGWAARCTYAGPYRDPVIRSLLTLKLLTFQLSGAVIAAPTASLPEHIGGVRNWDYRFCWLRDAALTFAAFADMGYAAEGNAFIGWLLHATRLTLPELQVLYDVYGETHLPELELDHLEGYRGSRPVRVGNGACDQFQLDTYGALVLAVHDYVERGGRLEAADVRVLVRMGRYVCDHWQRPDKGIWELRGEPRHNTHSKLMCWVALDRLVKLCEKGRLKAPVERFRLERDRIAHAIHTEGFSAEAGTFTGAFGMDYVEAGLLLLGVYGLVELDDERMVETCYRIERELGSDGLLYRHGEGLDGLPPGEGAFIICSFWMTEYLAVLGQLDQATAHFERLLAIANDVGLLAEEADPRDGSALGNFPQAYSHVGLIRAAALLERVRARHEPATGPEGHA